MTVLVGGFITPELLEKLDDVLYGRLNKWSVEQMENGVSVEISDDERLKDEIIRKFQRGEKNYASRQL